MPVPSKDTPPIFLAVSRAVAVAAFPVQEPELPEVLPVTFPVIFPSNVATNVPVAYLYHLCLLLWLALLVNL